MAGSLNQVQLIGNVGKDPEIRTSQAGKKIANLTIATSETWNDRQSGERKERTEWHRVAIMNDALSGVVERYVKKGSKLFVSGQLQTRKWIDQSGQDRYSTEVILSGFDSKLVMLDSKQSSDNGGVYSAPRQDQEKQEPVRQADPVGYDLDDEIPF